MNGLYYHFGIITYLILIFFVASCSVPKTITESKQSKSLEKAIQLSAKYLQKSVKENGMFEYRINTDPTIEVKQKYNILRHAGTIYAMSQYLELYPNDKEIRTAIEQAGRYLQNKAIEQVPGKKEMLAVWSKPEINNSGRPLEVKLGGTGLGLVALLSIENSIRSLLPFLISEYSAILLSICKEKTEVSIPNIFQLKVAGRTNGLRYIILGRQHLVCLCSTKKTSQHFGLNLHLKP